MRIILIGAPGAGKGTQADLLSKHLNIPQISTGNMLRDAIAGGTTVGQKVKEMMAKGLLVPDEIVLEILLDRISKPDCVAGFILDGFPRTVRQAEQLDQSGFPIDFVIKIIVPDNEIIARLGGRWVHPKSGRVYHEKWHKPKIDKQDDITGEPLIQREDDKEETIRKRLMVYHQETQPLIQWYQQHGTKLVHFQGVKDVSDLHKEIMETLGWH